LSNIETELKYLLSKESFRSLYDDLKQMDRSPALTRQVNYYFASPDSPLARHPINIRIRFIGQESELTCKIPISDTTTNTIQNSYEYNKQINREQAFHAINNGLSADDLRTAFAEMLQQHSLQPLDLICYGHLRTARYSFRIEDNLPPLLLDVNGYLGTFDYELEWELDQIETADSILQNIFSRLNISPIGQLKPKRRRFFEKLIYID
jgi:uncharacterized protein YjbK